MFVFRFTHFKLGAVLATSFIVAMLPRAGYGYTADEQQACTGDAFRLCSSDIPDVDRITACMIRNKSQLSPACRVYFRYGPESEAAPVAGTPTDIKPVVARKSRAKAHPTSHANSTAKSLAKSTAKTSVKSRNAKKPAKPAES
jgi:hypothetical protein